MDVCHVTVFHQCPNEVRELAQISFQLPIV